MRVRRLYATAFCIAFAGCSAEANHALDVDGGQSPALPSSGAQSPANSANEVAAKGIKFKEVYGFLGSPDAGGASSNLVDIGGTLYGTSVNGGTQQSCMDGCGTVFAVTQTGKESFVYSFQGGSDGTTPLAGLVNVGGTLYGTTTGGGANNAGTVFKISTSGTESVVYSFKGFPDGVGPFGGLVDVGGTLYGTTNGGGANNDGTVFSIAPSGTESVVYSFKGSPDGFRPQGPLMALNGTIYGTTSGGGTGSCSPFGCGTVFSVTPSGSESVVYSFKGKPDGEQPITGVISAAGTFYGTTRFGGAAGEGMVFAIPPSGSESNIYSFKGAPNDGVGPEGLVEVKGTLYGVTQMGGNCLGGRCGVVFSVTPSGTETVLYNFQDNKSDGEDPDFVTLLPIKKKLYGTTSTGAKKGWGTVFSLTP